jgi:hypothetical protein
MNKLARLLEPPPHVSKLDCAAVGCFTSVYIVALCVTIAAAVGNIYLAAYPEEVRHIDAQQQQHDPSFKPVKIYAKGQEDDDLKAICSGAIVGGVLYTAEHCVDEPQDFFIGGIGEEPLALQTGFSTGVDPASRFRKNENDPNYRDIAWSQVEDFDKEKACVRQPVHGERAWTIHWNMNRDNGVGLERFTVENVIERVEGDYCHEKYEGHFLFSREGNDLIGNGSSGAVAIAESDNCMIGVLSGVQCRRARFTAPIAGTHHE